MRAIVCDACGEVYKPYFSIDSFGEGNMVTIVKTEKDGKMHGKMRFDLCPNCMKRVYGFLTNDLLDPSSTGAEKYFSKKDNGSSK